MEEIYDLHQHKHCLIIYIGNIDAKLTIYSTAKSAQETTGSGLTLKSCITYDEQRLRVLESGSKHFYGDGRGRVLIDRLEEKIYRLFKRPKYLWDQDNMFMFKAISEFIRLSAKKLMKHEEITEGVNNNDSLHYAFIAPSEWEEEIRESLIRPMFVQAGLMTFEDHKDRLLFCSDIESLYYYLTDPSKNSSFSGRVKNTILARIISTAFDQEIIKFDLLSTGNAPSYFSDSIFRPKIISSNSLSLSSNDFKSAIKKVIKTDSSFAVQEEIIERVAEELLEAVYETANKKIAGGFNIDAVKFKLSSEQKAFLESISRSQIHAEVSRNQFKNIKDLISDNLVKKYNFVICVDKYSFGGNSRYCMLLWLKEMLAYNHTAFNSKNIVRKIIRKEDIYFTELIKGASRYVFDVIQNSVVYIKPRLLPTESLNSCSSIFVNSKPDAIMNIDMSLESTLLSFSLLHENGLVKEIKDHNYFVTDTRFSGSTTSNVKHSFISFVEKYLTSQTDFISADKSDTWDKNMLDEIEFILGANSEMKDILVPEYDKTPAKNYKTYLKKVIPRKLMLLKNNETKDLSVPMQRQKYFKAFVDIYLIHLKKVISSKLFSIVKLNADLKIGYFITIEKILLDRLFGTEEDLQDMIYASGILQKDDSSKKLRVILKGEQLLPIIQKYLKLEFKIKSFFMVAQLFKSHIQLTLNQVVTESRLDEEDQEAIIIQDEIILIPNVYDSLSLYMWNNIVEDNSSVQLCDTHRQYNDHELLAIFTLENKAEYTNNCKQYIFRNILNENPAQKDIYRFTIRLSTSCECRVGLTNIDIIEISFRPVLQDIISLVSTSLINKQLFGEYNNIQYLFHFINFNNNPQFQQILVKILNDETSEFIYGEKIDIAHYTIPKLSSQLIQPVLQQRPFSYKAFQTGTLYHVCSEKYGFNFDKFDGNSRLTYKNKRSDINTPLEYGFELFNKGDRIRNSQMNRVLYLSMDSTRPGKKTTHLYFMKFENIDRPYHEKLHGDYVAGKQRDIELTRDLPVTVSVAYKGYSYSLSFAVKYGNDELEKSFAITLAEPMTLARF